MNTILQYCLSAAQRHQGYTIVQNDEEFIELHFKGERFYSCHPRTELITILREVENHQIEYYMEVK